MNSSPLARIRLPIALLADAGSAGAEAPWFVDANAPAGAPFQEIPEAVEVASDGDDVRIPAGIYDCLRALEYM